MADKARLDMLLVERKLAVSRQRAKALIMAGLVLVDDVPVDKPGTQVARNSRIVVRGNDNPYVSRGGLKLEAALKHWAIGVKGAVCMDVGASTGGFTDCLLQHGARKVFAIDVGYGQLAWSLRQDERVVVLERTNIRHLDPAVITSPIDLAVIDVSFISLKLVVPKVAQLLPGRGRIIALVKPQFEVGKGQVGKGGVVRDPRLHRKVLAELEKFFVDMGLEWKAVIESPIRGPKGNKEYLASIVRPCPRQPSVF